MNRVASDHGSMWLRSLAWLALLAPLFFLSYGFANQQAAASAGVGSIFFEWERHIPFVPWTIVPYWSIDLLYGLSFLFCRSPREIDRHALRVSSPSRCISLSSGRRSMACSARCSTF